MNKTISIGLGGQNFIVEEEAADKLKNYLEDVKRHCGKDTDAEEVISDIETGLAEKLKASLTPYKEVITMADVEALIKVMGTSEDFDREVGEINNESENKNEDKNNNGPKISHKLYRDVDNALIGGVAAGLGAYFDIDPIIFRFAFIALCFAGGSGVALYIIMWLITPAAVSAHQKLEMKGEAPTVAAFERLSKNSHQLKEDWKKRWQERSWLGKILSLPFVALNCILIAIKKIWSKIWPIIKFLFGLFLVLISLIVLVGVGIGSFYLLLQAQSNYSYNYIPVKELSAAVPFVWLMISGFLAFALPALLAIISGLVIIQKKKLISLQTAAIIFALWMISGIAFTAMGLRYIPELKEKVNNYPTLQTVTNKIDTNKFSNINIKGNNIRVVVEPSAASSSAVSITGRSVDTAKVSWQQAGDNLNISENRADKNYCISCHANLITIKISSPDLKNINIEAGSLKISPEFKQTIKIKASGNSSVNWEEAEADNLNAELSDEASLSVTGKISSTSLVVSDARVHLDDFSGKNINITMKGAAAKADFKGQVDNLIITSAQRAKDDGTSDGSVDASALTVKKMLINSQGFLTIVSGPTEEIQADLSPDSRLFYTGKTKIDGDQKNKPIMSYQKIKATEYRIVRDEHEGNNRDSDYDEYSDIITDGDSNLIAADNGKYFRLNRGQLSEEMFKTMSIDFMHWLEQKLVRKNWLEKKKASDHLCDSRLFKRVKYQGLG